MSVVIYIHGFLSAPLSHKAQVTKAWLSEHHPDVEYSCPQLSSYPGEAQAQLMNVLDQCKGKDVFAIGSSLGGYWATYLLEQEKIQKAVLINPAVSPQSRLPEYIGRTVRSYYTEESYQLTEKDMVDFECFDAKEITHPEQYWLMVQKEDETLDYRQAVEKYSACRQLVEEGGNHSFVDYEKWLPSIADFFWPDK
ncbi:MAG: DNA repair protein RadA [Agarilytica sp.]